MKVDQNLIERVVSSLDNSLVNGGYPGLSDVDIAERKPYWCVKLMGSNLAQGVGFSKCAPGDDYNELLGFRLAFSRAAKDLVNNYRNQDSYTF